MLIEINEQNFEDLVLKSEKLTVVKFGFKECRPCNNFEILIEQFLNEYDGKFIAYNVDTENSPELTARNGILAAPTVLFFRNGKKIEKFTGYSNDTKKLFKEILDRLLA